MMLIDEFMPKYDFRESHDIKIRAKAGDVFRALNETDLCDSWIIRTLFFMRGLPTRKMKLSELKKMRFEMLGIIEDKEVLLGLAGKFWRIKGELQKVNSGNFREFDKDGFAKAVWDFSLDEESGETRLTTETRIECLDEASRKSFGFYWNFIKPFSGIIRMEMLKAVKTNAERG
ncbi:MAG: hypothetical protein HKN25_18365 [Pyrinomonadaceae bacterium]|nr:hypothetical protein [Pyrinomonadaceae bacterium]